jgi:hypothetical protein
MFIRKSAKKRDQENEIQKHMSPKKEDGFALVHIQSLDILTPIYMVTLTPRSGYHDKKSTEAKILLINLL